MKKGLRVPALALALVMTVSSAVFAASVPSDIEGTTYEEAVKTLFENGVVTGDTDGKFYPESNLTRAQACIMLVKAIDPQSDLVNGTATQSTRKTSFSDLKGYSWAQGYIAYAVEYGIVKGYPDGTFKPGANVTTNEMLTMVLRASGYTDDKIEGTWPEAHIEKAEQLGILNKLEENYPEASTKGMAAQMISNQLTELQKNAPVIEDKPQGIDKDTATEAPYTKNMEFATGSFGSDMTTFAGKSISKQAKIYTYGLKNDYSVSMTMSEKKEDYIETNVYRYKDTKTPVWYEVEDGKIVKMILPSNVGFTGNIYCVINDIERVVNGNKEAVAGFETLTAAKKVTWLAKDGLNTNVYTESTKGDGQVYELKAVDGTIKNIATTAGAKGKKFTEFTSGWTAITNYDDRVVRISGDIFEVKENASVYVWDDDKNEYKVGRLSSIKEGKDIRAYDVSDDDESSADVVVVK